MYSNVYISSVPTKMSVGERVKLLPFIPLDKHINQVIRITEISVFYSPKI